MELTSEIAILESVVTFASKSVERELTFLGKGESEEFLDKLEEAITDIIEGLENDNSEQEWWNWKLSAVFLSRTLQNSSCKNFRMYQNLPTISFDTYFDMVKRFDWFEEFIEVSCCLEYHQRFELYKKLVHHVQQSPVNHLDLQLISSLIGHFIMMRFNNKPTTSEESNLNESESSENKICIENVLNQALETISENSELLKAMQLQMSIDLFQRLLLLLVFNHESDKIKQNITRKTANNKCFVNFGINQSSNSTSFSITELFPYVSWVKCMNILRNIISEHFSTDILNLLDTEYVKFAEFSISTTSICSKYLTNHMPSISESCNALQAQNICEVVKTTLNRQLDKAAVIKAKEDTDTVTNVSSILKIQQKLPGFEDDVEKLLMYEDLQYWYKEGYIDMLIKNASILYKEDYIYRLLDIYKTQHNHSSTVVNNKFKKLIRTVFSNLPLLLQHKCILKCYFKPEPVPLLINKDFNSELTLTLNRFTSQSTEKVINEVTYLMLSDVKMTMKRLVDTVISNAGQIDTVIQIFQLLPDLCRSRHPEHHPNVSLLVTSILDVLQSRILTTQQQQNFLKFISIFIKDYKYGILGDLQLQEPSPLNLSEFLNYVILPFLNSDAVYNDDQPITLDFTLKLYTTILEQCVRGKPSDWLIGCKLLVTLILIGEIHHECLQSLDEKNITIPQLLRKLLAVLKNVLRRNSYTTEGTTLDWFMKEIDHLDWRVQIILHKFITSFITDGQLLHQQLLNDAVTTAIETGNLETVINICVINEESLDCVLQKIQLIEAMPLSTEYVIKTLIQSLPNMVSSEWNRVYQLVLLIVNYDLIEVPLRLMFLDKLIPTGNYNQILTVQLFNEAILIMSTILANGALITIIRCYTRLLQIIISQNKEQNILLLSQIFGHVCVTMATVSEECQETMFVCLLDILAEVKGIIRLESKLRCIYKTPFYQAVVTVNDPAMLKTIHTRLNEAFLFDIV